MKFKYLFIYIFLFIFCAITFDLGAGGGSAPELVFKSWQPGQSPFVTGPYIQGTTTEKQLSFLTNEETKCQLVVNVGYADDNPANAYQLNSYEFKIDAKVLLPGLSEEELKKHTFTFPEQGKQPIAAGVQSFSYTGEGTLSEHWGPSGGKAARCAYCPNDSRYYTGKTPQKGRELKITVKFIGYYGTDPNNEQKHEIELPLEQYERDQMRQEYLDHQRLHRTLRSADANAKYGDLYVPERNEFTAKNKYSDAHAHSLMLDSGLATKELHWTQACDKYVGEDLGKEHRITKLEETGGYRNSHHHVYHVDSGASSSTKYWSHHQYGRALDVRTVDMDGDGEIENSEATKWIDSYYMAEAAEKYANAGYRKWKYGDGHVHAQWESGRSTSSERVSQAPEEQQNNPSPPTPMPPTPPSTITYACGVHSGDASLASNHTLQASCSETDSYGQGCTVTNFYACQTHTHVYPALISGACGHTYTSANASLHALQASCLVTNANGDSCTVTGFYACGSHTHVYPVTCLRSGCRQSVSNQWVHLVRCSTCSKKYWSCDPVGVGHHVTVRTCRRTGCGVTFTNCTNGACSSDWGNFETHWPE